MSIRQSFMNGRHLAAARVFAGLRQAALAELAGLHVNSVKRLEGLGHLGGLGHAVQLVGEALRAQGIIAEAWPIPMVRLADGE